MKNKAKNQKLNKVDSIKKFSKKAVGALSVAAIAASAVATDVNAASYILTDADIVTQANASGDTNTAAAVGAIDIYTLTHTEVTFSSVDADLDFHDLISTTIATAVNVTGAGGVTITGTVTATINAIFTVATASKVTFNENIVDNGIVISSVILAGLGDIHISKAGAQNIDAVINSDGDNTGDMHIEGSGVKTFDDIVGGANELRATDTAAGTTAVFQLAMDSISLANLGTVTLNGASQLNTIANTGTLNINNVIDNIAANGNTVITQAASGSTVNLSSATARTLQGNIVVTTNGHGILNVADADGTDAAVQILNGTIGLDGARLGAINIGSATLGGSLKNTDTDAIFANAVTVTGGDAATEDSILDLSENITVTNGISLAHGAGSASLTSILDVVVASTVTGSGTGVGKAEINVSGATKTTTFNETVSGIDTIAISQASGVFKKNVTAVAVTLANAAGDATFNGTTAQTLTSTVTAANGTGSLIGSNAAGLTVTGAVGTNAARLLEVASSDGASTTFNGAIGAITLDIDGNTAAEFVKVTKDNLIGTDNGNAGALQINTGSVIHLDDSIINNTTVFNTTEAAADKSGVLLTGAFTIIPDSDFDSGTVKFLDGDNADNLDLDGNAALNGELAFIQVQDNALIDYQVVIGATSGADVNINAVSRSATSTANEIGTTTNEALALKQVALIAKGDSTLTTIFNNALTRLNGSTAATITGLAKQTAPQTDATQGTTSATRAMTGTVQGIVSNRMASLRSGDAYVSGMSAGNGMSANSGFIQAFASQVEQDNVKIGTGTRFGYDADTAGVAFGFDGITDSGSTIGLSASYSSTDVDGLGAGKAKNSIDSYTVSIYADKSTDNAYVEGSLTYGINDNEAKRVVNVSGINRGYTAAYDSTQLSAKVQVGSPNEVSDGLFVTPFGSATATIIDTDSYLEKSTVASDGLRLKVAQDTVSSYVGSAGIRAHKVTDKGTPMISFALNHEFGDTKINATNTYQGGGTAFKTSTDVEELSATLGLGYSFGNDLTSLNIGYEAEANDDEYLSHYGTVKIVSKF